jgi:hypothetical protein
LSRLKPQIHQLDSITFSLEPFIELLHETSYSRYWKVRQISASAFATCIHFSGAMGYIADIVTKMDSDKRVDVCHGGMLKIHALFERHWEDIQQSENNIWNDAAKQVLWKNLKRLFWVLDNPRYLDVAVLLIQVVRMISDTEACEYSRAFCQKCMSLIQADYTKRFPVQEQFFSELALILVNQSAISNVDRTSPFFDFVIEHLNVALEKDPAMIETIPQKHIQECLAILKDRSRDMNSKANAALFLSYSQFQVDAELIELLKDYMTQTKTYKFVMSLSRLLSSIVAVHQLPAVTDILADMISGYQQECPLSLRIAFANDLRAVCMQGLYDTKVALLIISFLQDDDENVRIATAKCISDILSQPHIIPKLLLAVYTGLLCQNTSDNKNLPNHFTKILTSLPAVANNSLFEKEELNAFHEPLLDIVLAAQALKLLSRRKLVLQEHYEQLRKHMMVENDAFQVKAQQICIGHVLDKPSNVVGDHPVLDALSDFDSGGFAFISEMLLGMQDIGHNVY